MFALELLNAHTAVPYSGLTFPHFRSQLKTLDSDRSMMAVGASANGQPVGLALAEVQPGDHLVRSVPFSWQRHTGGEGSARRYSIE